MKISLITNASLVIGCLCAIVQTAVIWQTRLQLQMWIYVLYASLSRLDRLSAIFFNGSSTVRTHREMEKLNWICKLFEYCLNERSFGVEHLREIEVSTLAMWKIFASISDLIFVRRAHFKENASHQKKCNWLQHDPLDHKQNSTTRYESYIERKIVGLTISCIKWKIIAPNKSL